MGTPRVLITFFSRSGNTEQVAFEIARDLGKLGISCDVEPLEEKIRRRRGLMGYMRIGRDALLGRRAKLRPVRRDPAGYDLVVVGTPVWFTSVSAPVRSFLRAHHEAIRRAAFFLTFDGRGGKRVFRQMTRLANQEPVAQLAIQQRELECNIHHTNVKQLVVLLAGALGVIPRLVATPRLSIAESAIAHG